MRTLIGILTVSLFIAAVSIAFLILNYCISLSENFEACGNAIDEIGDRKLRSAMCNTDYYGFKMQ
jgi:hypothetical protein